MDTDGPTINGKWGYALECKYCKCISYLRVVPPPLFLMYSLSCNCRCQRSKQTDVFHISVHRIQFVSETRYSGWVQISIDRVVFLWEVLIHGYLKVCLITVYCATSNIRTLWWMCVLTADVTFICLKTLHLNEIASSRSNKGGVYATYCGQLCGNLALNDISDIPSTRRW
jgi:hypothetical protein